MQAFEFVTKAEDGIIKIPKQFVENLSNEFRVIILVDQQKINKKLRKFDAVRFTTKDLKFNRDEANER